MMQKCINLVTNVVYLQESIDQQFQQQKMQLNQTGFPVSNDHLSILRTTNVCNYNLLTKWSQLRHEKKNIKNMLITNYQNKTHQSFAQKELKPITLTKKITLQEKCTSDQNIQKFIIAENKRMVISIMRYQENANKSIVINPKRKNILTSLEKLKNLSNQFERQKKELFRTKLHRKRIRTLQSRIQCKSISPLTYKSNLKNHKSIECSLSNLQKQQKKHVKSFRYNDIPVSEFIYEDEQMQNQIKQNQMDKKIQQICRKDSKSSSKAYEQNDWGRKSAAPSEISAFQYNSNNIIR